MLMTLGALLIVCLATSTRDGRAAASAALQPHEWKFTAATLAILAVIGLSVWTGKD